METSEPWFAGSRRLAVVAAAVAAILGVWAGAADARTSVSARATAFRWLHPRPPPSGWKLGGLPSGAATFAYPATWRSIRTDPGTASVALLGHAGRIRGYLNATPRQGAEKLASWPSFRIQHLREEGSVDVRLIAAAHGLPFRSGRGSCVMDSYRTSRARYREIACLVRGTRTTSVFLGAALTRSWAKQAETIKRSIESLRTQ